MLLAWIYFLIIISVSGGYGLKLVYKTAASRASLGASVRADPALSFIYGQLNGTSFGAIAAWRYLPYAAATAALMSIFIVVRHTRADEEAGRLELVGATAVGRYAALATSLTVAAAANVVVCVLTVAVLAVSGLPASGAAAYAVGEAGCGLVFAGLAAVAAQVSGTARGARGLAIATLAIVFLLRGIGDSGGTHGLTWLTWLSPIGWAELTRPFAAERWWVIAVPVVAALAAALAAVALAAGRDQGAGLVQPRPGPAGAGILLAGPVGLAWRLQRGALAGWSAGFLAGGLAIGAVATSIGKIVGSNATIEKAFTRVGGQAELTNSYLAGCMSLLGLIAAAYAVAAVLRLRADETAGRSEPLLAAPVSRLRWAWSYLLVALTGTVVVMVAGGLGAGLADGIAAHDVGTQVPRLIEAGLAQVPAALAVAAVAVLAVGLLPRWSDGLGWAVLGICGFIGLFGPALELSQSALDISPFTHVPRLPGGAFSPTPLIWLGLAAVAIGAVSMTGLRHRDIG
jgi:ABC-2 type transport system permease protein